MREVPGCPPGVEVGPVQQGAVVVVAHKVRQLHRAPAAGRPADGCGLDRVIAAPGVQQQDVKHQHRVRGDDATFRGGGGQGERLGGDA